MNQAPSDQLLPLEAFHRAWRRVAGRVRRTPLVEAPWLSPASGGSAWLKLEPLQITGSFKIRGALNAALALAEHLGSREMISLVTASAGNHGKGLACAAHDLGLPLVVFTPRQAPRAKLDAIGAFGADLRAIADTYEDTERLAKAYASETGARYVSPYSDPDVIAGAGTVALEVLDELPRAVPLDCVIVPVGGGGLISGIGTVVKALSPRTEVVGVEVEASHPFTASLAAGRIVEVDVGPSLADGLVGNMDPETVTFSMVRQVVDRIVLVGENDLARGIRELAAREHVIAEGAGIAALAAVLSGRLDLSGRHAIIIVSGGNIDMARLRPLLDEG